VKWCVFTARWMCGQWVLWWWRWWMGSLPSLMSLHCRRWGESGTCHHQDWRTLTESVYQKGCHTNHGYNFVSSWSICEIISLLQTTINFKRNEHWFTYFSAVKKFGILMKNWHSHGQGVTFLTRSVYPAICINTTCVVRSLVHALFHILLLQIAELLQYLLFGYKLFKRNICMLFISP